ncbi:hypothetical protein NQF87_08640 [Bombella sp. TMW 2.2559]|uniref:Uncharacterized protein n=1 Tax=Bombella dulcis TaxID=2967339 RepID=A0ABT3WEC9_9PROT|nr:hypothetical protein [Bombella dulcis]MCX5617028.1 hypothetical protein [Bombella dulcis]
MGFPNRVNYAPPLGMPGQRASVNPTRTAIPGELGHFAGSTGVVVGHFAWVQDDDVTVLNAPPASSPNATPTGFVVRDQNNINLGSVLSQATMTLYAGNMVTLHTGGDYFAIGSTGASRGQAVYASTTDGSIQTGPAGNPPQGTVATGWVVTRDAPAGSVMIISRAAGPNTPDIPAPTNGSSK